MLVEKKNVTLAKKKNLLLLLLLLLLLPPFFDVLRCVEVVAWPFVVIKKHTHRGAQNAPVSRELDGLVRATR
jgi:hypothetical protein